MLILRQDPDLQACAGLLLLWFMQLVGVQLLTAGDLQLPIVVLTALGVCPCAGKTGNIIF